MNTYHFRIYVYLQGDTKMLLCTAETLDAAMAIVRTLAGADRPEFQRIEIELSRGVGGM